MSHHPAASTVEPPPSTVNAPYVALSRTRPLAEFEKIKDLYIHNTQDKYFVQRLTERMYWIGGYFYCMCFYVGDKGVLLFDAPEGIPAPHLLQAVAEVTDLPITAITYSHYHADHIISAGGVIEDAESKGRTIRVIATEKTLEKMERFKGSLRRPTETVSWPKGAFEFEGKTVTYDGFVYGAHCDDNGTWLMADEEVCYGADLMNGDQLIFYKFGASERSCYYRSNIEQLRDLPKWKHFVGGHGNVGCRKDVEFILNYFDDLERTSLEVKATERFATGEVVAQSNNHAVLMTSWLQACGATVATALRPKYGKFYGFEHSVPSNAEMIILEATSYR